MDNIDTIDDIDTIDNTNYMTLIIKYKKELIKYFIIISGFIYLFLGLDFTTSLISGVIFSLIFVNYIDKNSDISGDHLLANLINIISEFLGLGKLVKQNIISDNLIPYEEDKIDKGYDKLDKYIENNGGNNEKSIIQPKYDGFMKLVSDLKKMIKLLTKYITKINNKINGKSSKDKSYIKLNKSLVKSFKKFTIHLKKFFISIDSEFDYPNLIYQEIKDIENKIYNDIHSLHFKLDVNSDTDIFNYSEQIITGIKYINKRLESYIEKDLRLNPTSGKGSLQAKTDEPQPINSTGIDNHVLEI